ncbi:MAG: argininosuccinate lyase [Candidatus Verstraetearchaeota archaeon]|nr:argininosuccinate lyase [Candidatus Verstraetearchaeota archaeon]
MKIVRGGRLEGDLSKEIAEFISSFKHDNYIINEVLEINLAHLLSLIDIGIINKEEGKAIAKTIMEMHIEEIPPEMEDIHMLIESKLIEKLGEIGGKLHTGKSRNDQVATAIRMRLRRFLIEICKNIINLQEVLIKKAKFYKNSLMPGFTHLQHAQPTSIPHYLIAYFDMFNRSFERLISSYKRINISPMGSAALAGTGYNIDRIKLANYLGFDGLVENTLDAVSTRDFALEVVSNLAIMMIDISRLAEEIIIWATSEFNYIELPDEHSSTSSIMPQKKNPVTAEILRAKCGEILGELISMLTIMKALPLSYNLDMQELTPHLWKACEITNKSIYIISNLIDKIKFNENRMIESIINSSSVATELADTLVKYYGIPFRISHKIVGEIVKEIYPQSLSKMNPEEISEMIYKKIGKRPEVEIIKKAIDPYYNINVRNVIGGPSPSEIDKMINSRIEIINLNKILIETIEKRLNEKLELLKKEINSLF